MVQKAIDGELDEPVATKHSGEAPKIAFEQSFKMDKIPKASRKSQMTIREPSTTKPTRAPSRTESIVKAPSVIKTKMTKDGTKKNLTNPIKIGGKS